MDIREDAYEHGFFDPQDYLDYMERKEAMVEHAAWERSLKEDDERRTEVLSDFHAIQKYREQHKNNKPLMPACLAVDVIVKSMIYKTDIHVEVKYGYKYRFAPDATMTILDKPVSVSSVLMLCGIRDAALIGNWYIRYYSYYQYGKGPKCAMFISTQRLEKAAAEYQVV